MKIENGNIYKITNKVNGKAYVGMTTQKVGDRWAQHLHASSSQGGHKTYLHRAISKYGKESFMFEIIEDGINSFKVLLEKEIYYIKHYDTFGDNGYNLTLGGEGVLGYERGDRKRVYKIDIFTGDILEEYESVTRAAKDNNTTKKNISAAALKDIGHSQGYIWVYKEDYEHFKYDKDDYSHYNGRILQLNRHTGKLIGIYNNTNSAGDAVKLSASRIAECIQQKLIGAGYIWMSEREYTGLPHAFDKRDYLNRNAVVKLDKDTEEVLFIYYSMAEAAKDVGLASHGSISSVVCGGSKTAGGYKWVKYSDIE